jgi:hypothetical protein
MLIPKRLHRKPLPFLCAVVFAANSPCAEAMFDLAWLLLSTAAQESTDQQPAGTSQEVYDRLAFGLASAQAASTGAKEREQVLDFFKMTIRPRSGQAHVASRREQQLPGSCGTPKRPCHDEVPAGPNQTCDLHREGESNV